MLRREMRKNAERKRRGRRKDYDFDELLERKEEKD
jgi:hypothetical protein